MLMPQALLHCHTGTVALAGHCHCPATGAQHHPMGSSTHPLISAAGQDSGELTSSAHCVAHFYLTVHFGHLLSPAHFWLGFFAARKQHLFQGHQPSGSPIPYTNHHYIKQQISVLGSTLFLCPDFDHFLFVHSFESILAQD